MTYSTIVAQSLAECTTMRLGLSHVLRIFLYKLRPVAKQQLEFHRERRKKNIIERKETQTTVLETKIIIKKIIIYILKRRHFHIQSDSIFLSF